MARVLITGSTTGLGLLAARKLIDEGHEVVLHARNAARADALSEIAHLAAGIVVGDLKSMDETRELAGQASALGAIDAVVHNAAIYIDPHRTATAEGHAQTLAVNVLAPYTLTCLIEGPSRLVYLSSGLHRRGSSSLEDIDWLARRWDGVQAYCDSKLYVAALALAVGRLKPGIITSVVDPGWVPTRMGGASAPDNLEQGYLTQAWLAVSKDPDATEGGGYWYHRGRQAPAPAVSDESFQDALLEKLGALCGLALV